LSVLGPSTLKDGRVRVEVLLDVPRVDAEFNAPNFGLPCPEGVAAPLPGTVGRESIKEAPNAEVGLKGFRPANPVACGCKGPFVFNPGPDVKVVPVVKGVELFNERAEKASENPDVVVVDVFCAVKCGKPVGCEVIVDDVGFLLGPGLPRAKLDATEDIF
jgi:hypothetical protein